MNFVDRLFSAQHKAPEVSSVLQQVTSSTCASEKRFEKIRNAEMGKFVVTKNAISAARLENISRH